MKEGFKSGFAVLLGRPNVGKSTLLNRLVGQKVAICSPKPQTTRNKIAGIVTREDFQVVFEDTPGIFEGKNALSRYMQKNREAATKDTDAVVLVLDGSEGLTRADREILARFSESKVPVIAAVNKSDAARAEVMAPLLAELSSLGFLREILPVSARTGENVEILLQKIAGLLPEGMPFYGEDEVTDKPMRFLAAEVIREKILLHFDQEIPHGVCVEIEKFAFDPERNLTEIGAVIVCEKASHKPILIGKGGLALKKIGQSARAELEKMLDGKVFLTLFVKVKEAWRDSDVLMNQLGFDPKKI